MNCFGFWKLLSQSVATFVVNSRMNAISVLNKLCYCFFHKQCKGCRNPHRPNGEKRPHSSSANTTGNESVASNKPANQSVKSGNGNKLMQTILHFLHCPILSWYNFNSIVVL